MNYPNLIATCGAIGAGKDTVAAYLRRAHGYTPVSFAGHLKDACLFMYEPLGLERRHLYGTQTDKAELLPRIVAPDGRPRTGREIAEIIGTEGGRAVDRGTWLKVGMAKVDRIIARGGRAVISDTRFENEFEAVRQRGGAVWLVVKLGADGEAREHSSDADWRNTRKDALIAAPPGRLDLLEAEVDMMLDAGGRRHAELFA